MTHKKKKRLVVAVVALAFVPMGARAQGRGSDAALGAISGAVVFDRAISRGNHVGTSAGIAHSVS
jgi:hypothetical protein